VKGLGMQVHEEVTGKEKTKEKPHEEKPHEEKPHEEIPPISAVEPALTRTATVDTDNTSSPGDADMDANTAIDGVLARGDPYPCGANISEMPHGTDLMAGTKVPSEAAGLESKFGRLVVGEGRSRYINNSHWANLQDEVRLNSLQAGNATVATVSSLLTY
jgi:hypothetical protein